MNVGETPNEHNQRKEIVVPIVIPNEGTDLHKIAAGTYKLKAVRFFQHSQSGTENDYTLSVSHQIDQAPKVHDFEMNHPRMTSYPAALNVPGLLQADGEKVLAKEIQSRSYEVSKDLSVKAKVSTDRQWDYLQSVMGAMELDEKGVYRRNLIVQDGGENTRYMVDVLTAKVEGDKVTVYIGHIYMPNGDQKKATFGFYEYSYEKEAAPEAPVTPSPPALPEPTDSELTD